MAALNTEETFGNIYAFIYKSRASCVVVTLSVSRKEIISNFSGWVVMEERFLKDTSWLKARKKSKR